MNRSSPAREEQLVAAIRAKIPNASVTFGPWGWQREFLTDGPAVRLVDWATHTPKHIHPDRAVLVLLDGNSPHMFLRSDEVPA